MRHCKCAVKCAPSVYSHGLHVDCKTCGREFSPSECAYGPGCSESRKKK